MRLHERARRLDAEWIVCVVYIRWRLRCTPPSRFGMSPVATEDGALVESTPRVGGSYPTGRRLVPHG